MTEIPTWFLQASLGIVAAGFTGIIAVIGFFLRRLIGQIDDHGKRIGAVEVGLAELRERRAL